MYEDAVNVPFIIAYPKQFKQNITNNSLVSFIDLMPTFAEVIDGQTPSTAQGTSLVELLENGTELPNRTVFSEFRGGDYLLLPGIQNVPSRMMRKGDYKFIYTHGIIDQLYDIIADPDELHNLIFDEQHQEKYLNMYFQTLVNWRFQEYSPMKVTLSKTKIVWKKDSDLKDFCVFYSKSNDFKNAELLAQNIKKSYFKVSKKGSYWVVAKTKLSKTSTFYGENIPVAVEKYNHILPISDPVRID